MFDLKSILKMLETIFYFLPTKTKTTNHQLHMMIVVDIVFGVGSFCDWLGWLLMLQLLWSWRYLTLKFWGKFEEYIYSDKFLGCRKNKKKKHIKWQGVYISFLGSGQDMLLLVIIYYFVTTLKSDGIFIQWC